MSSNVYAAAQRFELKPSRQRRRWRQLTHLAVLATLPLLQTPWLIAAVLVAVLMNWFHARQDPEISLLRRSDGGWTLFEAGDEYPAVVAEAPFVQPWLVILPLRLGTRRRVRRIAIFPDMLPMEEFRRLRVMLRRGRGDE